MSWTKYICLLSFIWPIIGSEDLTYFESYVLQTDGKPSMPYDKMDYAIAPRVFMYVCVYVCVLNERGMGDQQCNYGFSDFHVPLDLL